MDAKEAEYGRRRVQLVVALAMLMVFALVYRSVLTSFWRESQLGANDSLFKLGQPLPDCVSIGGRIVNLDPNSRVMVVRLELTPLGTYAQADGSLAQPLSVQVGSVDGRTENHFKAGQVAGSLEFSASLVGSASDYPFDHQQGHIEVSVHSEGQPVPLVVGGNAQISGFQVSVGRNLDLAGTRELPQLGPGFFSVTVEVKRSQTVVEFALFVMTIQWLMALIAWLVALEVVIGKRRPDSPMFGWMTAMLFALPPMRNIMVGVPPIGVYADYLAFLWCEGLIALSLTAVVLAWLWRRP